MTYRHHCCLSPLLSQPTAVSANRTEFLPSYQPSAVVPASLLSQPFAVSAPRTELLPSYQPSAVVPASLLSQPIAVSAHRTELLPLYQPSAVVPASAFLGRSAPLSRPTWHFPHNTSQVPCSSTHLPGLGCKSLPASGTPPGCPFSLDHNTGPLSYNTSLPF